MTEEKKLTDEKIIKALECCSNGCRDKSCFGSEMDGIADCTNILTKNALDLIHSLQSENTEQKAEIERLTEEKKTLVWLNQDLKKQVDEQDKEIDRLEKVVHEQAEQYYNLEQRTAVEILQKGRYCMPSGLRDWIKERYGVEVDE